MSKTVVEVERTIDADAKQVWAAMTGAKSALMAGTKIETDWKVGHPISFSGSWQGKSFKDFGEIENFEAEKELSFSHWSKTPERPENYHVVRYRLAADGHRTKVTLSQINEGPKPDIDDKTKAGFTKNWEMMLDGLKQAAEAA